MEHWRLVPVLAEAMHGQHARVAAWGPSPQYVSLSLVDAYGRTSLDIALLRYFNSPLPPGLAEPAGKTPSLGSENQKAVHVLREFVHRAPQEPSTVCGWELLRVLRLMDVLRLPSKKELA